MQFIKHPQHSIYMGAPRDWNEERDGHCGALSIMDKRNEALPYMESCWAPDGLEGARLHMGLADIRLAIYSRQHPPVSLIVYPKLMERGMQVEALKKAMQDLVNYAHDEGIALHVLGQVVDVKDVRS